MSTGLSSITLQSEKSSIITGDVVGRLNFLAGSETDTGDAIGQAASVYAQAENAFTSTTNQTALVFATANDDPATAKLKISGSGHFLPINTRSYNIGSSTTQFANSYTASGNFDSLILANLTPASTTNALYNTGGTLYFNGSAVGGGGGDRSGKRIGFFTPRDHQPPTTNYPTLNTRNSIAILEYTNTANQSGVFVGCVPSNADLSSGILTRINWVAATETSNACTWGVAFEKMSGVITTDSWGSTKEVTTTTNSVNGVPNITEIQSINAGTELDSLASGDFYRVKIYRNVSDTMTGTAQLISVELRTLT